jgi:AraC family transcriptional regulator of adaptative response/methylated-DNA-[protein]-cysteine methyltransferase
MQPSLFVEAQPESGLGLDEETCWQAVLNRDVRCDGSFYYGVASTQIFCRPSCASRRPNRDQVRFFASPAAAIEAGFRACKRCRPAALQTIQVARIQQACRLLETDRENPLSLDELSRRVGISSSHFQRSFKQITGVSPREYTDALRLKQLKTGLHRGESVLNARCDAGYGSSRGVYERADSQLGMTPATYGRGGKGAHISFAVVPCSLGFLLVAATDKGICSVALGDSPPLLEAALRAEFPFAQIEVDVPRFQPTIASLLRSLNGQEPHLDLPLDVQATAFQWRVWQILRDIAAGQTLSYSQVAALINAPQAARAVARACASNPVALIVPCHRVVRGDGSLSGYRWGVERKKRLLDTERERA